MTKTRKISWLFTWLLAVANLLSTAEAGITQSVFGTLPNGEQVMQYHLNNGKGIELGIITYGGIITFLKAPDKNGRSADIVLGYDNLADYIADTSYFGALIGRYGNRIAKGHFSIQGSDYSLPTNNGDNHLHGGPQGFNKRNWFALPFEKDGSVGLKLALLSAHGDQGYPGNLAVEVIYTLDPQNTLTMDFKAHTDRPTHVNLTQHSYFNLAGKGTILDHKLMIAGDHITPVDAGLIPTGELLKVASTPFDFRQLKAIGRDIAANDPQLAYGTGYDHNYVLNKTQAGAFELAAKVVEPESGRVLQVFTTEPGIQFYSGNFLNGSAKGKGKVYSLRSGFCLEPQHYPDSPNKANFPSTLLRPGDTYSSRMAYKFSVEK